MSHRFAYLADRARILRPQLDINKQVVSRRNMEPQPVSDWINARIRPVRGTEVPQEGMIKLVHSHEVVLHHHDESGNQVMVFEGDELELKAARNQELPDLSIKKFTVTGSVREIRKRTKVVSYIVPVILETEH